MTESYFRYRPGSSGGALLLTLSIGIAVATVTIPIVQASFLPRGWGPTIVSIMAEHRELGVLTSVEAESMRLWKRKLTCCERTTGLRVDSAVLRVEKGARAIGSIQVDPEFFDLLDVAPLLGRAFAASDWEMGENPILVTRRLARALFSPVEDAVGASLVVDGRETTIRGVLPDNFAKVLRLGAPIDVVRPLNPTDRTEVLVFSRLRDGVTLRQARAEISARAVTLSGEALSDPEVGWRVLSARELLDSNTRRTLEIALLAGAILLLATGVNTFHLLRARAKDRRLEIATRWALGATRRRFLAAQAREALALTVLAGSMAGATALAVYRAAPAIVPSELSSALNGRTSVGAFVVASAACFGMLWMAGALTLWRRRPAAVAAELGGGVRTDEPSTASSVLGGLHVISMIAAALVLLVAAFLLLGSIRNVQRLDQGFDGRSLYSVQIQLPEQEASYPPSFWRSYERRLAALPGVVAIASAGQAPPSSGIYFGEIRFETMDGTADPLTSIAFSRVSDGYFRTIGQAVVAGREFTPEEVESGQPVVVVSRSAARFLGADPAAAVGRAVWLEGERHRVVGVVADLVAPDAVSPLGRSQLYKPLGEPQGGATLLVRSGSDPGRAAAAIASRLHPDAVVRSASVQRVLWESLSSLRFLTTALSVLVLLVMGLTVTGVYGVFAGLAASQRRPMAVRMMLGARRGDVRWLMLSTGLRASLAGLALGIAASYPAAELLGSHLFGLAPASSRTRVAASVVILAAAMAAVAIPALRVGRVEPLETLRRL